MNSASETCGADNRAIGANIDLDKNIAYPSAQTVIDVTNAPYLARGDGTTDDTNAIQRAISDVMGKHKLLYFPNGTYLISKTLTWSNKNSDGQAAWGKNFLQGQNARKTVIRLKDGTFTDATRPESMMWCGGFGSADWFHNYVQDLTFDVGKNNPGAVGLQFYSNNTGAVRNCRFIASDGSGVIGLDLGHRDMNGPLLVENCEVTGFQRGINTAHAVNGQTFERITLRGQGEFGFDNAGQSISIRSLRSENKVPAIRSYGTLCLLDAQLTGQEGASRWPAIINYNGGRIFVRDVNSNGYARCVGDVTTPDWFAAVRITGDDKQGSAGPHIAEYCSHLPTSPPKSSTTSLRLPIKEVPQANTDESAKWANVDSFGADPTGEKDSSVAIQQAIDSGAGTVFFPGHYSCRTTLIIRGKAARLLGVGGQLNYGQRDLINFRITDGSAPLVCLEHFGHLGGGIEIDTKRTVVLRSMETYTIQGTQRSQGGQLFLEDVVGDNFRFRKQRVWARQLNIENEGTHLTNDGGDIWVLGYKTERGGTLVHTMHGGRTEIFGGFSYTTTAGKLAPMFLTDNSSIFAFFNEVCFNGDPFAILIQDKCRGAVFTVKHGDGTTAPYVSHVERK